MVKTSLEWPSRFALFNISLYSSGHKQIQEHFTGIFLLASSFLSSFYPFYIVGWTSSTLSILSPACTLRRVGWMGWRPTPMAMNSSHIPGLGGPYGLSTINLCGASVSETFPVGQPSNGWVLWRIRAGFLNFSFLGIESFVELRKIIEVHSMARRVRTLAAKLSRPGFDPQNPHSGRRKPTSTSAFVEHGHVHTLTKTRTHTQACAHAHTHIHTCAHEHGCAHNKYIN